MIRGNPSATWHQRARLSGWLYVLGPALAAAAVTATTRNPEECAWVLVVTGLICSGVRLETYPIHLMPTARFAARVGCAVAAATVAVVPTYMNAHGSPLRGIYTVGAAGVAAALIAMVDAVFAMAEVRIAVIGDASFAELLAEQFDDSGVRGFFFATWCSPDTSVEALKATLARKRIDLVVIENRVLGSIEVEHAVDACVELGVRLTDGVTLYERVLGHVPVAVIRSAWFRAVLDPERPATRVRLRRVRDIQIALMVAVVAAPVMLVVAAAVAICDGRPIFFRQRRIGKGGREFRLLKFRTMRSDPRPGASWATPDDPRITSLGGWLRKLHLDELPQLINVLRGEMTLVGPRPEQPDIVEVLEREIPYYSRRHLVIPGVTGWAQVRCGYAGSTLGTGWKIGHDLYYLNRRTLTFDALIMLETLRTLVADRQYGRTPPHARFLLRTESDAGA